MTTPELVVMGSVTTDNVLTAGGVPLPQTQGGNVIYAALGARIWSDSVGLVSRAGRDFGRGLLDRVAALGIATDGIRWLDEHHEMNCAFRYDSDGNRDRSFPEEVMATIPEADRPRFRDYTTSGIENRFRIWTHFAPEFEDIPTAWRADSAGFHFAAMPVTRHAATAAKLRAARPDAYVQVDSPWYDVRDPGRPYAGELFPRIDRLLPSKDDIRVESGEADAAASAERLLGRGLAAVVIKCGPQGCLIRDAGWHAAVAVPSCPIHSVDPTGAGDAFCGGFLAGFLARGDPVEAAIRGTVSASFAVEAPGPEGLLAATREMAEERYAALAIQTSTTGFWETRA
ncbi:MAG: carbohydrate kinase family protein [Bauldia sp.]|uniref:carbohydrate kinase family protein n=1 Tax=Bauldia sp. TaxID=2575872 RepID=UPI001D864E4D|nr:carbohydrate kinase family protein [Bauldia sp.]MCB1497815.1 carbohydrate kinase family protein [Bauldia sp.]